MARKTVYNNITSEELYNQVNEDNKDLINEFIEYLQSTDKAKGTIKQYTADLKIFFVWNLQNNKNKFFIDLTKRDVMKYQNYLLNKLMVNSSRIRRLKASLSSLSNFIENILDEDYPNFRNIINKIPNPTLEKVREKTVFEEEDLKKLLDYLIEHKKYQSACALALAFSSGARKSELTRFKVSYFNKENIIYGALYKTPEKIKTKGRGRKGKELNKFTLVKQFDTYLKLWMEERNRIGIDSEWLLVSKDNNGGYKQLSVSTLDFWAKQFTKILEVDFYWHSLRHFFTTSLAKQNIPDDVIKELVGWSNLEMVSTYKDIEAEDEFGKYFSEDGIKTVEQKTLNDI